MFSLHSYYQQDIQCMNLMPLPWERLRGKRILLAGATGLIGTFLVDTLFSINRIRQLGMTVYAVGRDEDTARQRFDDIWEDPHFSFYPWDVTQPATFPEPVDLVIHAACDTQPTRILEHPVETMMSNIYGTENLLEVAHDCGAKRFLFLSSGSIYGEPWRADDCVNESYYGSLSCNTVRAAYAESKRAGETLCKAWRSQYGLDVVIARLAHVYGPTMRQDDTKPLSQMILDCAKQQNIVLHEDGDRHVSCCYVADAVMGILYVLLTGKNGSAYNIAGSSGKLRTLKDIAEFLADYAGTKAIYDLPDREAQIGQFLEKVANRQVAFDVPEKKERLDSVLYTNAKLDTHKLQGLGWQRRTELATGLKRTVSTLQEGGLIVEESDEDVRNASLEAAKEAAASLRERHTTMQRDTGGLKGFLRRMR